MRREEKKKLFSKQNMVSLFIVFIMVSSVIGYMWGKDGTDKFKYNGYSFTRRGREWVLRTEAGELTFDYFPEDVENINLSSAIVELILGVIEIDSTSSANDSFAKEISLAQYSLGQTIAKVSNTYVRVGMIDENEFNLPLIDCKDATPAVPVLYFKEANNTKIELQGSCIIAEAKSELDILGIKDRLLYGMLGII